jgi:hypothetical protein
LNLLSLSDRAAVNRVSAIKRKFARRHEPSLIRID